MSKINLVLFTFFLTLISSNSYNAFLHYPFPLSPDGGNYYEMASGNYNVKRIHRYRVVIPVSARIISIPITKIYAKVWPHRSESTWPLRLGFFIVNTIIMAFCSYFLFLICRAYGVSFFSSLLATVIIIACRTTTYFAGVTYTDSLYFLMIIFMIYGIKTKNNLFVITSIVLGPIAKESFFLFYPIILLFSNVNKIKQFALFLLSFSILILIHYLVDNQVTSSVQSSIGVAIDHLSNIVLSFFRFFSVKGFFEVFSVLGLASIILVIGITGKKESRSLWLKHVDAPLYLLLAIIVLHMLLSTDLARMLFLAAPFWAVLIALIIDNHPFFAFLNKLKVRAIQLGDANENK